MKLLKILLMTTLLTLTSLNAQDSCCSTKDKTDTNIGLPETSATTQIKLPSIQCNMCINTIETGLSKVTGISNVSIDLKAKNSSVTYNPVQIDVPEIELVVSKLGYWANAQPADSEAYSKLDECCQMSDNEHKNLKETDSTPDSKKWKFWKKKG
ncbi:MAG: heavy-metal-associated domain-containing protein [Candidatus Marinimicrobia bacterium]|nr:heavy-metal-associated domain-containing protein [Candidatus Neomarinimicrobiota bacterium]